MSTSAALVEGAVYRIRKSDLEAFATLGFEEVSKPDRPVASLRFTTASLPASDDHFSQDEPEPLILFHTCRICHRYRSKTYHREHPITSDSPPTPPGICSRCRVKAIGDLKADRIDIQVLESERVRLGIECLVPEEAVVSRTEAQKHVKNQQLYIEPDKAMTIRKRSDRDTMDLMAPFYRHVDAADIVPTQANMEPAQVSTQNLATLDTINAQAEQIRELQQKLEESKKAVVPANVQVTGEITLRQAVQEAANMIQKPAYTESAIRYFARDEVEKYRQSERKLEAHPEPFAHGRMVPVADRVSTKQSESRLRAEDREGSPPKHDPTPRSFSRVASTKSVHLDEERDSAFVSMHQKRSVHSDHEHAAKDRKISESRHDLAKHTIERVYMKEKRKEVAVEPMGSLKEDKDNSQARREKSDRSNVDEAQPARSREASSKTCERSHGQNEDSRHIAGTTMQHSNDIRVDTKHRKLSQAPDTNDDDHVRDRGSDRIAISRVKDDESQKTSRIRSHQSRTTVPEVELTYDEQQVRYRDYGKIAKSRDIRNPADDAAGPKSAAEMEYWKEKAEKRAGTRPQSLSDTRSRRTEVLTKQQKESSAGQTEGRTEERPSETAAASKRRSNGHRSKRDTLSNHPSKQQEGQNEYEYEYRERVSKVVDQDGNSDDDYMEADLVQTSETIHRRRPATSATSVSTRKLRPPSTEAADPNMQQSSSLSQMPAGSKSSMRSNGGSDARARRDSLSQSQVRFSDNVGVSPTPPPSDDCGLPAVSARIEIKRPSRPRDRATGAIGHDSRHRVSEQRSSDARDDTARFRQRATKISDRSPYAESDSTVSVDNRPLAQARSESPSREQLYRQLADREHRRFEPRVEIEMVDRHGPYRREARTVSLEARYGGSREFPPPGTVREL